MGTRFCMKFGYNTAHSKVCIPPIDTPITACNPSSPSTSVTSRYWLRTMSRAVISGNASPV
jgi:hypothetical protein